MGGTDLNWGTTAAPYWNVTNSATNGSTAKGYVPETPWNDSCTNPLELSYFQFVATYLNNHGVSAPNPTNAEAACNLVANYWVNVKAIAGVDISSAVDTVGGSGGSSNCTSSNGAAVATCAGGYAKPAWQAGVTGIPSDNKRDIPDVSFFAGNGLLGSAYLICVSDWGACITSPTTTVEPSVGEIGGTSASSPAMAGVMALINQKAGSAQGNPNSQLYVLAGKQTYLSCTAETVTSSSSCYFNDIDTGTIAMPCASGSPNCTVSTSGDTIGVLSGFAGATGYDEATGLGSLNVANVVNGWSATTTGTATATVAVSASPASITSAQGTTVTVTVTGASTTPTGSVVLTSGTFTSSSMSLSGGSASFSVAAGALAVGTDTVTASYSGDTTYAVASGTTSVTVTQAALLTPTVAVAPASGSINTGQTLNVTATVTGTGAAPTGTVTLSGGGYTSSAQALAAGSSTFAIPANKLSAGTDNLNVSYSGDALYGAGSGSANVTVAASVFALTQPAAASLAKGGSSSATISLTSSTFYTGTVTLSCALTTSPAGASNLPTCSPAAGGGTITVTAGAPSGTGSVTVTTTAATASMKRPSIGGWAGAEGGAVLALLVFFGIPARRRGWRAMLGAFILLATLGSLAACGGGSSGGNHGGGGNPGTTAGAYTFTVTGTGTPAVTPAVTTTFTVTVN